MTREKEATLCLCFWFHGLCMPPSQACADVRAGPVFWQQMAIIDQLNGKPVLPEWLSTHPSHENRFTQLDRLIPQVQTHTVLIPCSFQITAWIKGSSYLQLWFICLSKVKDSLISVCEETAYTCLMLKERESALGAVGRSLNRTNEASGEMYIHLQTWGEEGWEEGETWGGKEKTQGFRKAGKTFCHTGAWISA